MPDADYNLIFSLGYLQYAYPRYYDKPVCARIYKGNKTWSSWYRNYDESILTNSALLSPLASALGVVQGVLSGASGAIDENLDTKIVGSYSVSTSASPFQTPGLILVLRRYDTCSQIFIGTESCVLGMRIGLINGSWNNWKQVVFNE